MAFRLNDKWIWDFWFTKEAENYHMFFLQADRSIGDPDLRHFKTSIGHAVSRDLIHWKNLGTCFEKSAEPAWDDHAIWSGSVFADGDRWYLFYTALSSTDGAKTQRIGVATSNDLQHWERYKENPVLELDQRWYDSELVDHPQDQFRMIAWRDPYVIKNPDGEGFRMYFTARHKDGPADGRGAIGIAHSKDLFEWHAAAPVTPSGSFNECEVPQYLKIKNHHYLIFSVFNEHYAEAFKQSLADAGQAEFSRYSGAHYYIATTPNGPWRLGELPFFAGNPTGTHYCGKIVNDPAGKPVFMGFRNVNQSGEFLGEVSNPVPVEADDEGRLTLTVSLSQEIDSDSQILGSRHEAM